MSPAAEKEHRDQGDRSVNRTWSDDRAQEIIDAYRSRRGPLLLILQALQSEFGYIDDRATSMVAEALNVSRAEVHGVKTFYRDLRAEHAGSIVIRVCVAESCQSLGSAAVVAGAEEALGIGIGEATPDGAFTLEQVFCLGNCALSPAMVVDGALVGRVDPGEVAHLIAHGGKR
jgi:formate dehydrogenase subunit gamma